MVLFCFLWAFVQPLINIYRPKLEAKKHEKNQEQPTKKKAKTKPGKIKTQLVDKP